MNGAGFCKNAWTARQLAESKAGAVVFGSITVLPREGNPGYTLDITDMASLNSIGLKNEGAEYWREYLPSIVAVVHDYNKPFILSIAGFSPEDYGELAQLAVEVGVDGIETNLGCPNAIDSGRRHRIAGFDLHLVDEIMSNVWDVVSVSDSKITVGIKVPPYTDPLQLEKTADAIVDQCDFVTTMNTLPNALDFKMDGSYLIDVPDGYAGMAGAAVLPFALGQVKQWSKKLDDFTPVIGVGGVMDEFDIPVYLYAGASAVQTTTALFAQGADYIDVLADYQEPWEYFQLSGKD